MRRPLPFLKTIRRTVELYNDGGSVKNVGRNAPSKNEPL
jgi:hypothetical protein